VERGGFIVTSPRGRVSGDTISLGWQAVAGATEYDAVVQDEEGKVVTGVLTEQTSEVLRAAVPWREPFPEDHGPALPPGRYVVEVTAHAPVVEKARSAFEVASPEQVARLERALGAIAARADRALAPLAQAHYALREGWLERARALSDEAASARPNDPEVEVLRRHIAARMGTR
jgi:hypothetical protein